LQVSEIDRMMADRGEAWPGRDAFLTRILPAHAASGDLYKVALMDGSVLVNAPFGPAIAALSARPAEVEVDRRLVYVDPTQSRSLHAQPAEDGPPGFFPVIFRAISTIPREQPIRDNLESLTRQSAALQRAHDIATGIQDEVTKAVRLVLGEEILGARPPPGNWAHGGTPRSAPRLNRRAMPITPMRFTSWRPRWTRSPPAARPARRWGDGRVPICA
jgi:hypothetical protein